MASAALSDLANMGSGLDRFDTNKSEATKVHVRVQQRNGRKCNTTIQGLDSDLDLKRILKALKKLYKTNGSITKDPEFGDVILLQGDQRANIKEFLLKEEIYDKPDRIVLHGF